MNREIVTPIMRLARRVPECGRIRLGVKTANGAMKGIDTLRFTAVQRDVLDELAVLYKGTVRPWSDPKANPSNQFELISEVSEIPVYIHPDGLSQWYEAWSGGGCVRRCDGITCSTPDPSGEEQMEVPCMCLAQELRQCKIYTRLNVFIPQVAFRGVWRVETKGDNAAIEIPGVFDLLAELGQRGQILQARLGVEWREKMVRGKKKRFVVPRLSVAHTLEQLQAGVANAGAIVAAPVAVQTVPALNAGPAAVVDTLAPEDDIVEAELVDEEFEDLMVKLRSDGSQFNLDPERFMNAVLAQVSMKGDEACDLDERKRRIKACRERMARGSLEPLGVANGRVQWHEK